MFVVIHEEDLPKDASTLIEVGRVPIVGEYIWVDDEHQCEVLKVIHTPDRDWQRFPSFAHDRERKREGRIVALLEVTPIDLHIDDLTPIE